MCLDVLADGRLLSVVVDPCRASVARAVGSWDRLTLDALRPRSDAGRGRRSGNRGRRSLAQDERRQAGKKLLSRGSIVMRRKPRDGARGRGRSLPRVKNVKGEELREVKRPDCVRPQTGACGRSGEAVSQPCRRHGEPVEATDSLRPTYVWRPTAGAINPNRQTVPSGRSDQPQPSGWCPATEAINPEPLNDAQGEEDFVTPTRRTGPRTKDQRQLRRLGPRWLRRAKSLRRASIPSQATIPVKPVRQGSRTQVSRVGKPGKA